jgi:hypothetical protein
LKETDDDRRASCFLASQVAESCPAELVAGEKVKCLEMRNAECWEVENINVEKKE